MNIVREWEDGRESEEIFVYSGETSNKKVIPQGSAFCIDSGCH